MAQHLIQLHPTESESPDFYELECCMGCKHYKPFQFDDENQYCNHECLDADVENENEGELR